MYDPEVDQEKQEAGEAAPAGCNDTLGVTGTITAVLTNEETGEKRIVEARNIITTAGLVYYAQAGEQAGQAGTVTTNNFNYIVFGTGGTVAVGSTYANFTQVAASEQAHVTGYPKDNDQDADNSAGAGTNVLTYLGSWAAGVATTNAITNVVITNATPGASEPLLMIAAFTSVNKLAADSLKIFVNHTFA